MLTDLSFHVRLVNLRLEDSSGSKKPIEGHAFFVEDVKDLAKRNQCREWLHGSVDQESTNRKQTTMVTIFEYMIGNTDFGISVDHNTRLIYSKKDSMQRPYVIPYDFDYSGFVNTDYSVPDNGLPIENVRQRLYRGFPRTLGEVNEVLDIYKAKKDEIYSLVNNFNLLTPRSKSDITDFLTSFYKIIEDQKSVQYIFVDNARNQ